MHLPGRWRVVVLKLLLAAAALQDKRNTLSKGEETAREKTYATAALSALVQEPRITCLQRTVPAEQQIHTKHEQQKAHDGPDRCDRDGLIANMIQRGACSSQTRESIAALEMPHKTPTRRTAGFDHRRRKRSAIMANLWQIPKVRCCPLVLDAVAHKRRIIASSTSWTLPTQ